MDFEIVYPERRMVSGDTLLEWAHDACANGQIERMPIDAIDAAVLLDAAGLITLNVRSVDVTVRSVGRRVILRDDH